MNKQIITALQELSIEIETLFYKGEANSIRMSFPNGSYAETNATTEEGLIDFINKPHNQHRDYFERIKIATCCIMNQHQQKIKKALEQILDMTIDISPLVQNGRTLGVQATLNGINPKYGGDIDDILNIIKHDFKLNLSEINATVAHGKVMFIRWLFIGGYSQNDFRSLCSDCQTAMKELYHDGGKCCEKQEHDCDCILEMYN